MPDQELNVSVNFFFKFIHFVTFLRENSFSPFLLEVIFSIELAGESL